MSTSDETHSVTIFVMILCVIGFSILCLTGFTSDGTVKLFDFGLCATIKAQREKTEQYKLTGNTGTLRYMAPEVVMGRSYNQSVDVYSFSILIWQIVTG